MTVVSPIPLSSANQRAGSLGRPWHPVSKADALGDGRQSMLNPLQKETTREATGTFARWQPHYAHVGIATFPVRGKRPAVRGHLTLGLTGSRRLIDKFPQAETFGFACRPSRITVLDVDSEDERLFSDLLSKFGPTPVVVRSGSGHFQAWYRNSGEGRYIKPDHTQPYDLLGHGIVVAPPSVGKKGRYELIQGSLDDLASLPPIQGAQSFAQPFRKRDTSSSKDNGLVQRGERNQTLWRLCMSHARTCSTIEELSVIAGQLNQSSFSEPLNPREVERVVASAWSKEAAGQNWFGSGQRIVIPHSEIDGLFCTDPDAFALLILLRRHHWGREFFVANAMHEIMPGGGWTRKRFTAARARLEDLGEIEVVTPRTNVRPAVYRFGVAKIDH